MKTAILLLLIITTSLSAQLSERIELAIQGDDMLEIHRAFFDLKREIKRGGLDEEEKAGLALMLFRYRDDSRPEVALSADEVSGSVSDYVIGAMVDLTDYTAVLNKNKEIDNTDPFGAHPMTDFSEKEFIAWFRENYLDRENVEDRADNSSKPLESGQDVSPAKDLIGTHPQRSRQGLEKRRTEVLIWVAAAGVVFIGGGAFLFLRRRRLVRRPKV